MGLLPLVHYRITSNFSPQRQYDDTMASARYPCPALSVLLDPDQTSMICSLKRGKTMAAFGSFQLHFVTDSS